MAPGLKSFLRNCYSSIYFLTTSKGDATSYRPLRRVVYIGKTAIFRVNYIAANKVANIFF